MNRMKAYFRSLWKRHSKAFLMCFLILNFSVGPGYSCDESLLILLTSDDPDSLFGKGIITLNREISSLGFALTNQYVEQYDPLMQKLMNSWLEFSSRYAVNPPEQARKDGKWQQKMREIGEKIGQIRKGISSKDIKNAHDETLALSKFLLGLFEVVEMSELKRTFVRGGELFAEMEEFNGKENFAEMHKSVASVAELLGTFTPILATPSREMFVKLNKKLVHIQNLITNASGTNKRIMLPLIDEAAQDFSDLRTRILAQEWFPKVPIKNLTLPSGEKQ